MSDAATASVLIIGNEILSGKTQDANLGFLGQSLARLGIMLVEARVVRDEPTVIAAVVNELREKYTYLFTTGGIGPTHDDLTAESVALAFGTKLERNEEAVSRISAGGRELTPARLKMAMIPQGASLIENPLSRAPGFRVDNVFVLAGIPSVARAMFEAIENDLVGGEPIGSDSVDVYAPEGDFAADLEEIVVRFPDVEIGSYPFSRDGRFGASIVVRGRDSGRIADAIEAIRARLGPLE